MITLSDIQNHQSQADRSRIFNAVRSSIDGRIPHDHMTILYVLRELLGGKCQTYLEIGVHNGGSMAVAMQSRYSCRFYGIDMFEKVVENPRWEYFRADKLSCQKASKNIKNCNIHNHSFTIIEGNSRDKTVIDIARDIGTIDLLFIDGDHTYGGVKSDFENYAPLVSSGGLVVFDDYNPHGHPDIVRFVDELNNQNWYKIGCTKNSFILERS